MQDTRKCVQCGATDTIVYAQNGLNVEVCKKHYGELARSASAAAQRNMRGGRR